MQSRKASIKETGEELSQDDWARFDAAAAEVRNEKNKMAQRGQLAEVAVEPGCTEQPRPARGA